MRSVILGMQQGNRCPRTQQPAGVRCRAALDVVVGSGAKAGDCAAVVALALDEFVAFMTEEGDGGWKSFGRLGGCDSVEVLATDHGGGKNMVRRSRGSGCESRGRQVCGCAKCMRTHVASEHKRLTKRHFAVGAADVWHAC